MKTQLINILLLGVLLYIPKISQAQVSLNVSKNYPAHIVYKIDDIVSIVKLDEVKQIKIAKKFQKIDSLANVGLANGESVNRLKSDYTIDVKFLKTILSQEELERFTYVKDSNNRFLAALNSVSILNLQPEQLSKIRQLNDSLSGTPKMTSKESAQFQNKKLRKILNPKQNVALLKIIYKEQAMTEAKEDWLKIVNLKINTPGKEKEELHQLVEYYSNKKSFLDKIANQYTAKQIELLEKKIRMTQPTLLIYANMLSETNYSQNKFVSLIQFKNDIDLSQAQIDSLLLKYKQCEKVKCENFEIDVKGNLTRQKIVPSEFDEIPKIITVEQINKWLIQKHKTEAIKRGNEYWYNIEDEGLSKGLDKDKTMLELRIYYLKYLVASDKSKFWKTPEMLYLLRDVERNKPEILQQLDAITKSKSKNQNAKNAMAW